MFKKASMNSLAFLRDFITLVKANIISLGVPVLKRYAGSKACLGISDGQ